MAIVKKTNSGMLRMLFNEQMPSQMPCSVVLILWCSASFLKSISGSVKMARMQMSVTIHPPGVKAFQMLSIVVPV